MRSPSGRTISNGIFHSAIAFSLLAATRLSKAQSSNYFYGDGSAGSLAINSNKDWMQTPPATTNFQFTNVVVKAALTVPSGLTLKMTGNLTIIAGGSINVLPSPDTTQSSGVANPGVTVRLPKRTLGGGIGIDPIHATQILRPPRLGILRPLYAGLLGAAHLPLQETQARER